MDTKISENMIYPSSRPKYVVWRCGHVICIGCKEDVHSESEKGERK
jgi:hypothetical protein